MLARHLVLIQSHIPLAFSQSALSSELVREKAGADTASMMIKVTAARLFIPVISPERPFRLPVPRGWGSSLAPLVAKQVLAQR